MSDEEWARAAVAWWLGQVLRGMARDCEDMAKLLRREERRWA